MTLLTGETDVFSSAAATGRCAVLFLAKRQPVSPSRCAEAAGSVGNVLRSLASEGWFLSVRAMIEEDSDVEPSAFATGFAHDCDMAGAFEAPSIGEALAGTVRLERAGWSPAFATEWLIGPREFAAVAGSPSAARDWGLIALWEWNDAWAAASPEARREYDAECDVAFKADLALGIDIAGRHRLDWASSWHHLGIWEADAPETIDRAMRAHETAADFKFTTSRHFIGPRRALSELIGSRGAA